MQAQIFALLWPATALLFGVVFLFFWKGEPQKRYLVGFSAGFLLLFLDMGIYIGFPGQRGPIILALLHMIGSCSVISFVWAVCRRAGHAAPLGGMCSVAAISALLIWGSHSAGQDALAVSLQHNASGILFLLGAVWLAGKRPVDWLEWGIVWIFSALSASGLVRPVIISLLDGRSYDGTQKDHSWIVPVTAMTPMIMTVALGAVLIALTVKDKLEAVRSKDGVDPASSYLDRSTFDSVCADTFSTCKRLQMPASFAIFELNRLDDIRKEWGEDIADTFLATFSGVLRDIRRDGDILGRVGEDQIGLFLVAMKPTNALHIARQVEEKLAQTFSETAATRFKLSLVCGIAGAAGCEDFQALAKKASESLNLAKKPNSSRFCIDGNSVSEPLSSEWRGGDLTSLG